MCWSIFRKIFDFNITIGQGNTVELIIFELNHHGAEIMLHEQIFNQCRNNICSSSPVSDHQIFVITLQKCQILSVYKKLSSLKGFGCRSIKTDDIENHSMWWHNVGLCWLSDMEKFDDEWWSTWTKLIFSSRSIILVMTWASDQSNDLTIEWQNSKICWVTPMQH